MITWLNHVAIAVPDLAQAVGHYRAMGVEVSDPQDLPEHGITVVFVMLPNTKIELLHPLGGGSPIGAFLEKNPSGGIHHLCFEVTDIGNALDTMKGLGARVVGNGDAKIGAHGKPVIFVHPKDFHGALVEFEQN